MLELFSTKKPGFLLVESLAAVIIFGLAVAAITNVLSVRFKRMHQTSFAVLVSDFLAEKLQQALNNPTTKISKVSQTVDVGHRTGSFEIASAQISENSDLYSFSKVGEFVVATIKTKEHFGKEESLRLAAFRPIISSQ